MSDVNFTPTRGAYKELTPFRYWCQKVLPLVYDDSISYYELLCKVVNYLNITMEDVGTLNDDVTAMYTAYDELQDFVNQYFTDLNVQTQIDNKLDRMAADGSLNALIDPLVIDTTETSVANTLPGVVNDQLPDVVEDQIDNVVGEQIDGVVADQIQDAADNWLGTHISGSNALDSTLTLYNAAARSMSAGNLIDTYAKYLGAENRITAFAAGYWENDNGVMVHPSEPNLAYMSAAITVNPGDKYTIIAPAFIDVYSYVPRYAFTDSNYNIISASDTAEQGAINKTVTVPAGATKFIVNDNLVVDPNVDTRFSKMLLVKGELTGTNEISDLKADLIEYSQVEGFLGATKTIELTGASTQNSKFYFNFSIPAGTYRVRINGYNGSMYFNSIDKNGNSNSNQLRYWIDGIPNVITATTEIAGFAIYTISSWTPVAKTVTVILENYGKYSDAIYAIGTELEHEEVYTLASGTTLNESRNFSVPFPAGVYSVSLGDFEGQCLVSLKNNSTLLNRWYEWSPNKKRYFYSSVDLTGVAVYLYNPSEAGTLTLTIERVRLDKVVSNLIDAETNRPINPVDYGSVTGDGTPSDPYVSPDGSGGLYETTQTVIDGKGTGQVRLPVGCYDVSKTRNISTNCLRISGDVWNYSGRPNGVTESNDGVKLKSIDRVPIFNMTGGNGQTIEHIGFVGSVSNGYTVGLFDRENPTVDVGIYLATSYSDQFTFERLSFTGLGAAICASGNSNHELDAFTFRALNTDGCNIGIIFDNVTTFYSKIKDCIIADTPAYGLFLNGPALGVVISENMFVRNCGKMTDDQKAVFTESPCSVYIGDGRNIVFANNQINRAGDFYNVADPDNKFYEYDDADALYIKGVDCSISGNTMMGSRKYGIVVEGSRNSISGNTVRCDHGILVKANYSSISGNTITIPVTAEVSDVCIRVEGNYNSISGNYMSRKIYVSGNHNTIVRSGAENVVIEAGASGNVLVGFDNSAITDNGTNTVIK